MLFKICRPNPCHVQSLGHDGEQGDPPTLSTVARRIFLSCTLDSGNFQMDKLEICIKSLKKASAQALSESPGSGVRRVHARAPMDNSLWPR